MGSLFVTALLIATQLPSFVIEKKIEENAGKQRGIVTTIPPGNAGKGKARKFKVAFEFSMEQKDKNGDIVVEGKTIPGSTKRRIWTTLVFSDGEVFVYPHTHATMEARGRRYSTDDWIEIKVTSTKNDLVHLLITAKQCRSEPAEAGASSSWNLSLEATKTVKLGEKFKLEFGDEDTIGTKCTFEGVIEEKAVEAK